MTKQIFNAENNHMNYLSSTYFFDFENKVIQNLIQPFQSADWSDEEKAIACYLKVRDHWWYNAYQISFTKEKWKASVIAQKKDAHCLDKSIILISCLRALGIPARLQLAKVKNHIAVERLIETFGTNELTPHGMVNLYLGGKWLKVSPAFNAQLCEKCGVAPLNFDGKNDSVFQEYNNAGKEFMEYLEDYGHFEDVPLAFIINNLKEHYPKLSHYLTD